jgi:hypothetical protein
MKKKVPPKYANNNDNDANIKCIIRERSVSLFSKISFTFIPSSFSIFYHISKFYFKKTTTFLENRLLNTTTMTKVTQSPFSF